MQLVLWVSRIVLNRHRLSRQFTSTGHTLAPTEMNPVSWALKVPRRTFSALGNGPIAFDATGFALRAVYASQTGQRGQLSSASQGLRTFIRNVGRCVISGHVK